MDGVAGTGIDLKTPIVTSGDDPPDLPGLWPGNVLCFAAPDASEALEDCAARFGITPDALIPVFDEACRCHGRPHAVPGTQAE